MNLINISKKGFRLLFGGFVLSAAVAAAFGQDSPRDEYQEWQKAKREAAREQLEYKLRPTKNNYLGWRSAQRDANREYEEYLLAIEVSQRYPRGSRGTHTWVVEHSDVQDEYDEWKSAQRERAREYEEYIRNRTRDNYLGWQDAIADERREYSEYKAAVSSSKRKY